MDNKEYLNEEQYKKSNKKVKTIGLIVMIIGLCLIFMGISFLADASQMEVPQMGAENRYEIKSAKIGKQATGSAMIIPGFGITLIGCMLRFIVGNRRNIMAYQMQQVMPIAQEGMEKMTPTLKNITNEMAPSYGTVAKEIAKGIKAGMADEEFVYCKHCGAQIDSDSSFCKVCGKQV